MNDKTKHRIVGIVVIAAFLVILVPALMNNSFWGEESNKALGQENNAGLESDQSMTSSSTSSEPESFQTSQVAQVSLNESSAEQPLENPVMANANSNENANANATETAAATQTQSMESMKSTAEPVPEATMESPVPAVAPVSVPVTPPVQPKPKLKPAVSTPAVVQKAPPKPVNQPVKQKLASVCFQLGTFSNANNVQALLTKLRAQGFPSVKATSVSLANGQKVQRVSLCQQMANEAIPQVRAKLTKLVGTAPMVTK